MPFFGSVITRDFCKRSLGAWALCHWSPDRRKVPKLLSNLLVHLLQLSRSNHLVQPECPALVFDQLETGVPYRTHQLHCVIIAGCWCIYLNDGNIERTCSQPHCHGSARNWAISYDMFTISLCTRKPTPCSCLSSLPQKYTLWPPSVGISPDFLHLILQNPRMLHLCQSFSCKCSSTLPAALRVLTFHIAMVMSSFARLYSKTGV